MEKVKNDNNDNKTLVFFGHSFIFDKEKIKNLLYDLVEREIKNGFKNFLIGKYGDFDEMALSVCRELRKKYSDIKITVVVTSYAIFNKKTFIDHTDGFDDEIISYCKADKYSDVETISYFVEQLHFKRRITETNRCMINDCDYVICYVDPHKSNSGAKKAVDYANKMGKHITNICK